MNRWPKSIHSQVEAVFHSIRSFRESKDESSNGIRSFGSWRVYRTEAHQFATFLEKHGTKSLMCTDEVTEGMRVYLETKLVQFTENQRSRQTFETALSGLGKLEYGINQFNFHHNLSNPRLDTHQLRMEFYERSKKALSRSSRDFISRAYPAPIALINAITDPTHQLQAALQYEGGLRCEGAGAPANGLNNPINADCLQGYSADPVTGQKVGVLAVKEKGGKITEHYLSVETYDRLKALIDRKKSLASSYSAYLESVNQAARQTGQYAEGRGTHGLKHNFAQERYLECIKHGMTHEQALQQTSLETAHFRLRETLTYTRG